MDKIANNEAFALLRQAGSALIGDALGRLGGISDLVRYDSGTEALVGVARTVRTRAGDNLALYASLMRAIDGEVLVVDAGACIERAVAGDLLRGYAAMRGVTGFVVDGAIRDTATFRDGMRFGCFARGVSHRGPFKDGPGELDVPVAIAGHAVSSGDIVVADSDGIVSFAAARLDEIVASVATRRAAEDAIRAEIATGSVRQSWIESAMDIAGSRLS